MKQIVNSVVTTLFALIGAVAIFAVQDRISRERALNEACDLAVFDAVLAEEPVSQIEGDLGNLLQFSAAGARSTTVSVEPLVVDEEKGIVAVSVREDFKYPFDVDGKIEVKRVAVEERNAAQYANVIYFAEEDGNRSTYKEYSARIGFDFPVPAGIDGYEIFDLTGQMQVSLPQKVEGPAAFVLKKR